ncbi:response regulator [Pseudomonas sp.]|uniref:response regulator n=1 Tax=Pseudomonas sp. TaxID=306 RepID=UPI0028A91A7E|nr:response regulator [Pseudomonas sp.]
MCRRVLLIEDDSILRFLIADALSYIDVEVIECTTADAGLVFLENAPSNSVAFVLTDIRTPGILDGFELAKIVWERWPELPVILTSGHRSLQEHELPAHSMFMAKPWTLDQLYEVVAKQLPAAIA